MFGLTSGDDARTMSDEEVLLRSQAEPWLFGVLLDRYQDAFLRKARTVLRNELDVEEVVQDTFTKIYQNAEKFTPQEGAKFSSWAYRILLNTAFTRYQKASKEQQRFVNIDPEYEHTFGASENHSGFAQDRDAVDRVLVRLPEQFSYVLRLHYLERWSHHDIATETGETVGAIKARIHRAKAAFRKIGGDDTESLLQ